MEKYNIVICDIGDTESSRLEIRDKNNMTPLLFACRYGKLDAALMLLNKGASVDAEDKQGCSSLMLAASWGHEEIIQLLISRGADVNHADEDHETAIKKYIPTC